MKYTKIIKYIFYKYTADGLSAAAGHALVVNMVKTAQMEQAVWPAPG
ncbi:hypothetical protein [Paludibacterium sp. B53371]|nr:hypothetical protein [Paludibacterium sp. B53371]